MTEAEKVICRLYLEDMDKNHTCNEYRLLMELLDKEPCEDAISRQAAINEIARWIGYLDDDMVGRIQLGLKRLQSAQPEIIRCKNCGWWSPMLDSLQGRCALHGSYPTGAWYCGNARRK